MMALTRLVLEARGRLARRDFEHVRKLLDDAIASFPNELPPRIYRSRVLLEEGTDLDAAEAALRDLTERAPRLEEGWRNLALLLRNRGRPADAVTICRAGRQHCPNDGRLMLYEGLFLAEAGDPAGAEPYLLRYLESQPAGGRETVEARHELAKIYLSRGRFSDAEAQWRALLADQPHFAGARQGLAEIHRRKSRLVALQA